METFIIYESYAEALKELNAKDRLAVYDALMQYGLYGEMPELTGVSKAIFTLIKPAIDSNKAKRKGGKKGGRPKKEKPMDTETKNIGYEKQKPMVSEIETYGFEKRKPMVTKNHNLTHSMNEEYFPTENTNEECGVVVVEKKPMVFEKTTTTTTDHPAFSVPSLEDVSRYRDEIHSPVDPEKFRSYYESIGWKSGKKPITDWKAAFRYWTSTEHPHEPPRIRKDIDAWVKDVGDQSPPDPELVRKIKDLQEGKPHET